MECSQWVEKRGINSHLRDASARGSLTVNVSFERAGAIIDCRVDPGNPSSPSFAQDISFPVRASGPAHKPFVISGLPVETGSGGSYS